MYDLDRLIVEVKTAVQSQRCKIPVAIEQICSAHNLTPDVKQLIINHFFPKK